MIYIKKIRSRKHWATDRWPLVEELGSCILCWRELGGLFRTGLNIIPQCLRFVGRFSLQFGRQAASRTIIVGTAIWQRGRQASAIWHRDRAGLSVGESIGGRRLVWSGVSASRAGALGTGHRRHWFVVSRKELQALLYSSPSFVRSCLRPGRIRTPGNH